MTLFDVGENPGLVDDVKALYDEHGMKALDIHWLRENARKLAFSLAAKKISLEDIAIEWQIFDEWHDFIQKKILDEWKDLYDKHSTNAFRQNWLEKNKLIAVLRNGQRHGLSLKQAAEKLGVWEKVNHENKIRPKSGKIRWTQEKFDEIAKEVIEKFGTIPPKDLLRNKGYGGFEWAIRQYGKGYPELRKRFGVHNIKLESVDHQTWLSMPEVSAANFLIARGIKVQKGKKYPDDFTKKYRRNHAIYDLHFEASQGELKGQELSVEIWGGGCGGDPEGKKYYAETRKFKEDFHKDVQSFIGIEFNVCYNEKN